MINSGAINTSAINSGGNGRNNFEKWLKAVLVDQNQSVNKNFEEKNIKASYDTSREVIIIHYKKIEFSKEEIEDTFSVEKDFKKLVDRMM